MAIGPALCLPIKYPSKANLNSNLTININKLYCHTAWHSIFHTLVFTLWVYSEKHLIRPLKSEQVYRSKSQTFIAKELAEGISYRLYSVYKMLAGESEPELVVTEGFLKSSIWLRITADFFGKKLWIPKIEETSSLGGIIAGWGVWASSTKLKKCW